MNKKAAAAINPMVETQDVIAIKEKTGNLYESIVVMSKRASQINVNLKTELQKKLDEFSSYTDSLEEVQENKEQIEISKYFERMANAPLLSTTEFLEDKIYYRKKDDQ